MRYDGLDRRDLAPLLPRRARLFLAALRSRRADTCARDTSVGLAPATRLLYPVKAGMTHARSVAWLARRPGESERLGLRILLYHRVADDGDALAVPVRRFREQMQVLEQSGYRVLDVESAVRLLDDDDAPERTIGLSFDDGFRDVAEAALPQLAERGFSATLFVPTGVVGGTARFGWYRRQPAVLGWAEIVALDCAGTLRCEAHSVRHPNLTALGELDAREEIVGSKRALEERLDRPVEVFCYPGGVFGSRERRLVIDAGYRLATSCEPGLNRPDTDRFALRRIQIDARDRLVDFRAKLGGGHDSPLPLRASYRRLRYAGSGRPRLASSAR
jgi:peptidoglycan/xylan/chitin deacetylase (PgdA/CDA1 family)